MGAATVSMQGRPVSWLGIFSLVSGVLALVVALVAVIVPVVPIVLGFFCLRETRAVGGTKRGAWMGLVGIVLGTFGLAGGVWNFWQMMS